MKKKITKEFSRFVKVQYPNLSREEKTPIYSIVCTFKKTGGAKKISIEKMVDIMERHGYKFDVDITKPGIKTE